jgi:hypothetical protein
VWRRNQSGLIWFFSDFLWNLHTGIRELDQRID